MSQQPLVVVVATQNNAVAASLAESLRRYRCAVQFADGPQELETAIARHRAAAAIADLELVPLSEVERLHGQFQQVNFVCTHRVPDEQMWADTLAAGAADCCYNGDHDEIVRAALGLRYKQHSNAA
jgi:DNA-binding NtrC family response regulator